MPDGTCLAARVLGALFLVVTPPASAGEEGTADQPKLKLGGYYKNLLVQSKTVFPEGDAYIADLNRLRLELQGKPAD